MRRIISVRLIAAILLIGLDAYAFQAVTTVTPEASTTAGVLLRTVFWSLSLLAISTLLFSAVFPFSNWYKKIRIYLPSVVLGALLSKLVLACFVLADDAFRILRWGWVYFINQPEGSIMINRLWWIHLAGLFTGGIPFALILHGMMRNVYNYKLKEIDIQLKDLPEAFDGMTIVQISDIHAGSLMKMEPVVKAVDRINELNADLIFFTGDLVNNKADEIEPFLDVFGRLKAKYGVFSITGNHDYGDYIAWPDKESKLQNFQKFQEAHKQLGWRLLMNENELIKKDGEIMAVVGIENWSSMRNFQQYGKLQQAMNHLEPAKLILLLSHDPSHWQAEVTKDYPQIDVTFSGHTHGFQFGIESGAFQWSPGQYFYKHWAGLYKKDEQYLYVNRGFGYTFYPGRIGMLPEISLFTLRKT